jgi:hypothetical protein
MTKISVLVPFGADESPAGRHRTEVWNWCRRRWQALLDMKIIDELVVGHDPLHGRPDFERPYATYPLDARVPGMRPFSVSRALNDAAKHAHGDQWLMFGADHVPDVKAIEWASRQLRLYSFARIYERVAYASQGATAVILGNSAFPLDAADWHEVSAPCPGVLGVRREAFERAGGLDERYEGWGYEDTAFLDTLARTHQNGSRGTMGPSGLVLRELWHDGSRRDLDGRNAAIYREGQP